MSSPMDFRTLLTAEFQHPMPSNIDCRAGGQEKYKHQSHGVFIAIYRANLSACVQKGQGIQMTSPQSKTANGCMLPESDVRSQGYYAPQAPSTPATQAPPRSVKHMPRALPIYCGGGAKFCVSSLRCTAPKRELPWSKICCVTRPLATRYAPHQPLSREGR